MLDTVNFICIDHRNQLFRLPPRCMSACVVWCGDLESLNALCLSSNLQKVKTRCISKIQKKNSEEKKKVHHQNRVGDSCWRDWDDLQATSQVSVCQLHHRQDDWHGSNRFYKRLLNFWKLHLRTGISSALPQTAPANTCPQTGLRQSIWLRQLGQPAQNPSMQRFPCHMVLMDSTHPHHF